MESLTAGIMVSHGTCDRTTGTFTSLTGRQDPVAGATVKEKQVPTKVDKDHMTGAMLRVQPDGAETEIGEITCARRAGGPGDVAPPARGSAAD